MREERRWDPTTGELVLLSTARQARPQQLVRAPPADPGPSVCPFCPGREDQTPPPTLELKRQGRWVARSFANKYPAVSPEAGAGVHEVLVERRAHDAWGWRADELADALTLATQRMQALSRDRRLRSLTWFRNHGPQAGASLFHPHAQVVGLVEVPPKLASMVERARVHHAAHGQDLLASILERDLEDESRVVYADPHVVALCPWAPRGPFEVWLVPRAPGALFTLASEQARFAVADVMARVLAAFEAELGQVSYNAWLYQAPLQADSMGFRWHMRLMPRLTAVAGFELGTGGWIHGVFPDQAAARLRAALPTATS